MHQKKFTLPNNICDRSEHQILPDLGRHGGILQGKALLLNAL